MGSDCQRHADVVAILAAINDDITVGNIRHIAPDNFQHRLLQLGARLTHGLDGKLARKAQHGFLVVIGVIHDNLLDAPD